MLLLHILLAILSFASLALGQGGSASKKWDLIRNALKVGNVAMIKPKVWGSQTTPGNAIPHPAAVIANDETHAHVVQLTHKPIEGQHVVETKTLAPSLDKSKGDKKSYMDMKPRPINIADLEREKKDLKVAGQLPPEELKAIQQAVSSADRRVRPAAQPISNDQGSAVKPKDTQPQAPSTNTQVQKPTMASTVQVASVRKVEVPTKEGFSSSKPGVGGNHATSRPGVNKVALGKQRTAAVRAKGASQSTTKHAGKQKSKAATKSGAAPVRKIGKGIGSVVPKKKAFNGPKGGNRTPSRPGVNKAALGKQRTAAGRAKGASQSPSTTKHAGKPGAAPVRKAGKGVGRVVPTKKAFSGPKRSGGKGAPVKKSGKGGKGKP